VQAPCPSCGNRIVVDDSRVPDRAFSVKCPKCQTMVKFAGRPAGGPAAPEPPPAAPAAAPVPRPAPPPPVPDNIGEQTMAHLRRELAESGRLKGHVLVALPDRSLAGALTLPLSRIGYAAEAMENPDDAARALEQGLYDVVITSREGGASSRGETLMQRIARLAPDVRRTIFLVLVGEDFRTGDGTQAFTVMADLVVHPRDAAGVEPVLLTSIAERNRLYQAFLDTKKRLDSGPH
jgi:predicted Zn finger-like uncharacterized protein